MDQIISLITKSLPKTLAVYLYGSRADGTENPGSDYDIAVLLPFGTNSDELFSIAQDIAVAIRADVDLIDLNKVSLVLQFQVISRGKTIFVTDEPATHLFEMKVISMYQRFNEERKEILHAISSSGQILS